MGKFFYCEPEFKRDANGNIEIINKHCFGPIEVIIYGINKDNNFYFDWTFPAFYPADDELENEYIIISKEKILEKLDIEINLCRNEGNDKMVNIFTYAKEFIINEKYESVVL